MCYLFSIPIVRETLDGYVYTSYLYVSCMIESIECKKKRYDKNKFRYESIGKEYIKRTTHPNNSPDEYTCECEKVYNPHPY